MGIGTLKFFDTTKGFGFISPDEGGADVFVHQTKFDEAKLTVPEPGTPISFTVTERNGKVSAANLVILPPRPVPVAEPTPAPQSFAFKPIKKQDEELDFCDRFEREWSMRRVM